MRIVKDEVHMAYPEVDTLLSVERGQIMAEMGAQDGETKRRARIKMEAFSDIESELLNIKLYHASAVSFSAFEIPVSKLLNTLDEFCRYYIHDADYCSVRDRVRQAIQYAANSFASRTCPAYFCASHRDSDWQSDTCHLGDGQEILLWVDFSSYLTECVLRVTATMPRTIDENQIGDIEVGLHDQYGRIICRSSAHIVAVSDIVLQPCTACSQEEFSGKVILGRGRLSVAKTPLIPDERPYFGFAIRALARRPDSPGPCTFVGENVCNNYSIFVGDVNANSPTYRRDPIDLTYSGN